MNRRSFFTNFTAWLGVAKTTSLATLTTEPAALPEGEVAAWLREWRALPRFPTQETSADAMEQLFLRASQQQVTLQVTYLGGSTPGAKRSFTPALIFRTSEEPGSSVYAQGWCHTRQANRTLRLDRVDWARVEEVPPPLAAE